MFNQIISVWLINDNHFFPTYISRFFGCSTSKNYNFHGSFFSQMFLFFLTQTEARKKQTRAFHGLWMYIHQRVSQIANEDFIVRLINGSAICTAIKWNREFTFTALWWRGRRGWRWLLHLKEKETGFNFDFCLVGGTGKSEFNCLFTRTSLSLFSCFFLLFFVLLRKLLSSAPA